MAEVVVGVVASGISIGTLAAQITSGIIKLKSYWDQVQDAPEDMRDLIEELEDLNQLLIDIEEDQRQNPISNLVLDPSSSSRCLQHCKQGATRLKELTDSLSEDIEGNRKLRRKWASMKLVLKKDKIDKYRAKLQRVISLLNLSHQIYTRTLIRLQPDIIMAKLSQMSIAVPAISNEPSQEHPLMHASERVPYGQSWTNTGLFGTIQYSRRRYTTTKRRHSDEPGRKEEREEIVARYRAPVWLLGRAWSIHALHASSGWTFSPRSYNIIPPSSIIYQYIKEGNVDGVRELFQQRGASPFDCTTSGVSLLDIAASGLKWPLCKLLIEQGADVDYDGFRPGITPVHFALHLIEFSTDESRQTGLDVVRLLLRESHNPPKLEWYRGQEECFYMLQQSTDPLYYQRPLADRVEVAFKLVVCTLNSEPALMQCALGESITLAKTASLVSITGKQILHSVAFILGSETTRLLHDDHHGDGNIRDDWRVYLKSILAFRPSLHCISLERRTPFVELVAGCLDLRNLGRDAVHASLFIWLEDLHDSGVDLEEYGRKEIELYEENQTTWGFRYEESDLSLAQGYMECFSYGPLPSDWKLVLRGQKPIPGKPVTVPGGWIDDDGVDDGVDDGADEVKNEDGRKEPDIKVP